MSKKLVGLTIPRSDVNAVICSIDKYSFELENIALEQRCDALILELEHELVFTMSSVGDEDTITIGVSKPDLRLLSSILPIRLRTVHASIKKALDK